MGVRKEYQREWKSRSEDANLFHSCISPERAIIGILQRIELDVAPEGMRSARFVGFGQIQQTCDFGTEGVALWSVIEIDGYAELSGSGRGKGECESFLAEGKRCFRSYPLID